MIRYHFSHHKGWRAIDGGGSSQALFAPSTQFGTTKQPCGESRPVRAGCSLNSVLRGTGSRPKPRRTAGFCVATSHMSGMAKTKWRCGQSSAKSSPSVIPPIVANRNPRLANDRIHSELFHLPQLTPRIGSQRCRHPAVYSELLKGPFKVGDNAAFADVEDFGDGTIALAHGNPGEDLFFPRRKLWLLRQIRAEEMAILQMRRLAA